MVPEAYNSTLVSELIFLKKMAAHNCTAYLLRGQYNLAQKMFTINSKLHEQMWRHKGYDKEEDFDVYVNPEIKRYLTELRPQP